jgi:F-type H+-transporting ATPase subunit gamma
MPENLRVLKGRLRTAKNIAQIAKTLEMVSISKIRRARGLAESLRPYAERITVLLQSVSATFSAGEQSHPYLRSAPGKGRILLVIGAEKGLCGPLPGNLVRRLVDTMDEETRVICVGRRMEAAVARAAGSRLVASFPLGLRLPSYSLVFDLVRIVDDAILSGRASTFEILFTRFVSYFSQAATLERLVPVAPLPPTAGTPPVFEPSQEGVLQALLPHFLEVRLFDALVQSYSAEQAARMVAMQNAKSNALEIADSIALLYNKTRQERITGEILDLANKGRKS